MFKLLDFPQNSQTNNPRSHTPMVEVDRTDPFELLGGPSLNHERRHLTKALMVSGTDCKEVRDGMDKYVTAEIEGASVYCHFPDTWLHIQACQHCREFHDLFHFITRETLTQRSICRMVEK